MFDIAQPNLPTTDGRRFPVRRIFCVGKNYRAHAAEMGDADAAPVFFMKPAHAVFVPQEDGPLPYPLGTSNLHHETELVVALGEGAAPLGVAAGCDLTRRDLQAEAKAAGAPWDAAKGLDHGAVLGPLALGPVPDAGRIALSVNGEARQDGDLADMVLGVPALLGALARLWTLRPGDLIFTGTPSGVGPLERGDACKIEIEGCPDLRFTVAA